MRKSVVFFQSTVPRPHRGVQGRDCDNHYSIRYYITLTFTPFLYSPCVLRSTSWKKPLSAPPQFSPRLIPSHALHSCNVLIDDVRGDCYLPPTMAIAHWAANWHIRVFVAQTAIGGRPRSFGRTSTGPPSWGLLSWGSPKYFSCSLARIIVSISCLENTGFQIHGPRFCPEKVNHIAEMATYTKNLGLKSDWLLTI